MSFFFSDNDFLGKFSAKTISLSYATFLLLSSVIALPCMDSGWSLSCLLFSGCRGRKPRAPFCTEETGEGPRGQGAAMGPVQQPQKQARPHPFIPRSDLLLPPWNALELRGPFSHFCVKETCHLAFSPFELFCFLQIKLLLRDL